jgi:hypothetical protein
VLRQDESLSTIANSFDGKKAQSSGFQSDDKNVGYSGMLHGETGLTFSYSVIIFCFLYTLISIAESSFDFKFNFFSRK